MKPMFESRTVTLGVVVAVGLFFPLSFVHELGHAIVCESEGLSYTFAFSLYVFSINCYGELNNVTLYYASGGILAMMVTLAPFAMWNWIRKHRGVMIGLLSLATMQGFNAILEGGFTEWYLDNTNIAGVLIALVFGFSLTAYIMLFARIRR